MSGRSSINLGARRLSYLDVGAGFPVVFLHALGRSAADWSEVMAVLGSGMRCLALDQRGHGHSDRVSDYTFELMAEDLLDFVDALGLASFSLVGHSMGGTVAWLFAEQYPNRLARLVIEDTPPPTGRDRCPEVPECPPATVDYDWEARRQIFRQLNDPDPSWWDLAATVPVPTLLLAGGTPTEELAELARTMPDARLVTIEAGHWIHESRPHDFVTFVGPFLTKRD